jgi:hypothetical protein
MPTPIAKATYHWDQAPLIGFREQVAIIFGSDDMMEIECLLEYRNEGMMGGDNIPRRPPLWECVCGCRRFRKVNRDGTDAPVKEIESAYQAALEKKDDMAIALALSPCAQKTAELVNSGAYEAAAGSCYAIFRCLAKTCKEHEDWFAGFTGYGDTYTKLAIFTEAVVELYCHLRQKLDLSKRMADEMDINLEVFNLETDFFGDLHCSSRFTDMLCDAQAQYGDYSELDMCPMWGMWEKEGGE